MDEVTDAGKQVSEIVDEAQSAGYESAGVLVAGSVIMALLFIRKEKPKNE